MWSIEHILSGVSIGTVVKKHHERLFERLLGKNHGYHSWHFNVTGVLCLGFAWEVLEHYLETGIAGHAVEYWFQGVEFWPNRLVADPLMLVLGYIIAKRYPWFIFPARIASLLWLCIHVFLFPHSMYLQNFFSI